MRKFGEMNATDLLDRVYYSGIGIEDLDLERVA